MNQLRTIPCCLGACAGIAAAVISPWFLLYLLFPVIWDLAKIPE